MDFQSVTPATSVTIITAISNVSTLSAFLGNNPCRTICHKNLSIKLRVLFDDISGIYHPVCSLTGRQILSQPFLHCLILLYALLKLPTLERYPTCIKNHKRHNYFWSTISRWWGCIENRGWQSQIRQLVAPNQCIGQTVLFGGSYALFLQILGDQQSRRHKNPRRFSHYKYPNFGPSSRIYVDLTVCTPQGMWANSL